MNILSDQVLGAMNRKKSQELDLNFKPPDNHVTLDQGGKAFQRLLVKTGFESGVAFPSVDLVLQ